MQTLPLLPIHLLLVLFILLLHLFQLSQSSGVIEMRLLSFKNDQHKDQNGFCCADGSNKNSASVPAGSSAMKIPPLRNSAVSADSSSCVRECRVFFRICLKQYQNVITLEQNCTYGTRFTEMTAGTGTVANNRQATDGNSLVPYDVPMHFPFPFAWIGDLTVIVEAWHVPDGITNFANFSSTINNAKENRKAADNGTTAQLLLSMAERKSVQVGKQWTNEIRTNAYSRLELQYRVTCDEHYYGTDCAGYCKPRDDTFGHFLCNDDGQKVCMDGWTGDICNIARCLPGCHPEHGTCSRPNECQCRLGYVGQFCDQCMRYPGCQHGTCRVPYECNCVEGWGGLFCNQDLNYCTHHKPCLNGATCTNTGAGHYTCTCRLGYVGTNCELKIETCALSPCFNGATCKESGTNYTCLCPEGYSGKHCQTYARTCSDNPCENGASCINLNNGYMCTCGPGWEGKNCDIEIDMCQSQPCVNGGSCVTHFGGFTCLCPTGYTGQRCEVNRNDCQAGGHQTCLNGGTCVDEVDNFKCVCQAGFFGTLCQHNVDDCVKRPCANGGTCFDLVNDYKCECRPGFKGKDCSIDINECESSPCRYGATCEDLVGDYVCHCLPCYTGKDCRQRDDRCLWKSGGRVYPMLPKPYFYATTSTAASVGSSTFSSVVENDHDFVPPTVYHPEGHVIKSDSHHESGSAAASASASANINSSNNLPLVIGVPLIILFILITIALVVIIFFLLRRSQRISKDVADKSTNDDNGDDDDETARQKENIRNLRIAAVQQHQQHVKNNNLNHIGPPLRKSDNRLSMITTNQDVVVKKVDDHHVTDSTNHVRSSTAAMVKNLINVHNLSANQLSSSAESKVYKIVSLDKLNYPKSTTTITTSGHVIPNSHVIYTSNDSTATNRRVLPYNHNNRHRGSPCNSVNQLSASSDSLNDHNDYAIISQQTNRVTSPATSHVTLPSSTTNHVTSPAATDYHVIIVDEESSGGTSNDISSISNDSHRSSSSNRGGGDKNLSMETDVTTISPSPDIVDYNNYRNHNTYTNNSSNTTNINNSNPVTSINTNLHRTMMMGADTTISHQIHRHPPPSYYSNYSDSSQ